MSAYRRSGGRGTDWTQQHRDWLGLIDTSGPFLSLPVLKATWPTLDALDKPTRERLRLEHSLWLDDTRGRQRAWITYVLAELLGWGDALQWNDDGVLDVMSLDVTEHETRVSPTFALVEPGEDPKPKTTRVLGMVCPPGTHPTARISGETWSATPVDRLARLCRYHEVELGLVTDGRWWVLVRAPRDKVTTAATFDGVAWSEFAELTVVRAFVSLLSRTRFFGVPADETLERLLERSEESQEEITEALGVQVRQAVELLVAAIGRADTAARERGGHGLQHVDAHTIYRGAVSVMMRIVFLLFAEERKLLPSDNELYLSAYSVGDLSRILEEEARLGSEDDLEHSFRRWQRLLALFRAVYQGIEHPRLRMHAHDGSLFDPEEFPWLPLNIDDRTVLHTLRAVQYVQTGTGKNRELRRLSFRELDVEQIGYVYEGLLSYDSLRADDVVVGLVGKEGLEDEPHLFELEDLAARSDTLPELAAALADRHKDSRIGSARAIEKRLVLDHAEQEEAKRKLLAVTRGDATLTERLLPFYGIIRQDLRGLPFVVMPGELYVTESPLRKLTGTHYTPRHLAEQIVEGALEPLVYSPGPLDTADRDEWNLKSSDEILSLKVADIAVGSAAFLVAAARYLAAKLIEAWTREGDKRVVAYRPSEAVHGEDEDPVVIEARRQVIEHCLYGVDINPMAVEMAKLSLWLVSMDPDRPFTFLDDRIVEGDSLLGITSLDQLRYLHMDPKRGRQLHEDSLDDATTGVRALLTEVAKDRRQLAEVDGSTLEGLARKRALLADIRLKLGKARLLADLTVAAALRHARAGQRGLDQGSIHAADLARNLDNEEAAARHQVLAWLETDRPPGGMHRHPLHWPLTFPEVFEKGGFDAIIGNPPFLGGQKLTGALGTAYREYVIATIARGARGSADLIAYFFLRAHAVLNNTGQTGLIATNTLAQGDTREVGLEQLLEHGITIRQAIKSDPWPSKYVALEYCAVWTSCKPLGGSAIRLADGVVVPGITASLDPAARVTETPRRLVTNRDLSFQGSNILGLGFTMEPAEAAELIDENHRNADVLFPYLNGQDLNSRPDCSASRWVINFHEWPEERAKTFPDCYDRVRRLVKPERERNRDRRRREIWWRFTRPTPELYSAIAELARVIVITLVSKTVMPVMVPTSQVYSHALGVFATDDTATLAMLSSAPHYWWAKSHASSMRMDLRYTPSDVFETFPMPELTDEMRELGDRLDAFRRDVMQSRNSGLTKTYNLVFDPDCKDEEIEELRHIHRAIDEATIRAYGWEDRIEAVGGLDHGFHKVGRETRYTIGPAAQREVLDSLLELNHERYAEEVAQGLHGDKAAKKLSEQTGAEALF
jgi:hypothetical protein